MSTAVDAKIGTVVWHDLLTPDAPAAQAFYAALLGWTYEVWKPGEVDYPMIQAGGAMHGGVVQLSADVPAPPHWMAYVAVEDVDATAATARSAGGSVLREPFDIPEVGRTALIADPTGASISLFSGPDSGMPRAQGVFAWEELLTSDVPAAVAFYGSVLGWTSSEMPMGTGAAYTIFANAAGEMVAGGMPNPREGAPSQWLTYLATDDVDATAAKAVSLGGAVHHEPFDVPGAGRIAVIADPTSGVVGLFKPATG